MKTMLLLFTLAGNGTWEPSAFGAFVDESKCTFTAALYNDMSRLEGEAKRRPMNKVWQCFSESGARKALTKGDTRS